MNGLRFVALASPAPEVVNFDLLNEIMHDQLEADFFGGTTATMVAKHFDGRTPKEVNIRINSNGGHAREGITIYNLLREVASKGAKINVKVLGQAASAASIVAMAGDKITMAASSTLMIHKAGISGRVAFANAKELREKAAILDKLDVDLARIYANRSGGKLTEEKALELMDATTYISDREAVEYGLATETDPELQAVALGEEIGSFEPPAPAASNSNKENSRMFTKEEILAKAPEVAEALRKEGRDAATQDALNLVTAERSRVLSILALAADWPGHQETLNALAADGKTTAEQAGLAILQAEAKTRRDAAAVLTNHAPSNPKPGEQLPAPVAGAPIAHGAGSAVGASGEPLDAAAKREWDSTPALASEFDSFESFLAWKKDEAKNSNPRKAV